MGVDGWFSARVPSRQDSGGMRVNVDADSLEQLNLRTRDGAERAGARFADALDLQTTIGATRITIASQQDLVAKLLTGDEECMEFEIDGPLSGTAILSFDEPARHLIQEHTTAENGVDDLAAELLDAFIEEWEDHVEGALTVKSVTYVPDPGAHHFDFESLNEETESTPLFQGSIDVTGQPGSVKLYLIPDSASLETLLSSDGESESADEPDGDSGGAFGMDEGASSAFDDGESEGSSLFDDESEASTPLPLDKLSVFSDLTRAGTQMAADRVASFTGIDTETEISGINFTPIDDISTHLDAESYVGTTLEFEGKPSGHLVIMFPDEAAMRIAQEMLPMDPEGDGLTQMHKSALEELGNIMASGFIDGWANVLQTSVDHTPPEFSDDMELTLLELVTDQLGPFQTHAYTIESRITTDSIAFDCEIHALPNEAQLSEALEDLLVARRDQTEVDPDDIF